MASIEFSGVSKSFETGKYIIRDLDLKIKDGEFLVLVGPSGCGKSTTLRLIAGLESPDGGEIRIDGTVVNDLHPKDRNISMVFQNYALYPHMTVYDNMAFGLKLAKYSKEEIRERVMEAAGILELEELLERKPRQLSGGQRQRVALGRAIVRKPKVFLFDEPLSNLDAKLRVQMRAEIKKLYQQLGITMVYVTHDQVEAMTMGVRIAVMKDGVIHQLDTPMNVYKNPADTFTAGFIGSPAMNFMPLDLENDTELANNETGFTINMPAGIKEALSGKKGLMLGIRPEDLEISEPESAHSKISASVDLIEPLGSETILYLRSGGRSFTCIIHGFDPETHSSETVDLYFPLDKLHYFDTETSLRIG